MRKYQPQPLNAQHLEDAITCLNLVYPKRTLLVSKKWYFLAVKHDLLDDCCFNVVVSDKMFNPLIPQLL